MLTDPVTWTIVLAVLAVFTWIGSRVTADHGVEDFALAGRSESGNAIGLSFLASGLGAWTLATPPEIGATSGMVGVLGYGIAVALPLVALALLGTRLRALLPDGRSLADFARRRYGPPMQLAVAALTVVYMGVALAAELTAASGILSEIVNVDSRWIVTAIVLATITYTAYGGLRASLRTDAWQAWLLLGLVIAAGAILLSRVPDPGGAVALGASGPIDPTEVEVAAALIVAILVTTLFHNGMWQRVWAARDDRALRRGALIGAATRVPLVVALGLVGVLALGMGADLGDPPQPLFALLGDPPGWVSALMLLLLVALVASSLDTLENGLASLVATEIPGVGSYGARLVTVAMVVPATFVAFQGWSVLQLLMLANLLCGAAVAPALMGLWRRATTTGAVVGTLAGLACAYGYGIAVTGGPMAALGVVTFAEGPRIGPFAAAIGGAALTVIVVSLVERALPVSGVTDRAAGDTAEPALSTGERERP